MFPFNGQFDVQLSSTAYTGAKEASLLLSVLLLTWKWHTKHSLTALVICFWSSKVESAGSCKIQYKTERYNPHGGGNSFRTESNTCHAICDKAFFHHDTCSSSLAQHVQSGTSSLCLELVHRLPGESTCLRLIEDLHVRFPVWRRVSRMGAIINV